ncbi:MAG: YkgJ family cysteine cluster protein [Deltaproteobacteria bacterium]|nr:YkgJ family cysteine cluster protein [Deltaproteobacteria bacterium]
MKKIEPGEICRRCADCCKKFPFVELTENEIERLERVTGLPFEVFTNPKGKTIEEYFLKFRENGYCFFLDENDDTYSCRVYESRPEICRNFPSTPVQKEACSEICKKL